MWCRACFCLVGAAAIASAAGAQVTPGAPPKNVTVGDVATQPLGDVHIQKKEIPPLLQHVLEDPYSLEGLRNCHDIVAAVSALNAVLGPDFDVRASQSRASKRRNKAMGIAGNVVSSFIPFRWLVREASGANKADDDYRIAIYAGAVRRGFLKGYGKQRKCKPPGSPRVLTGDAN